jgi:hypothetical protein
MPDGTQTRPTPHMPEIISLSANTNASRRISISVMVYSWMDAWM